MPRDGVESLEHLSGETADHGFKFQAEIMFYLCLQIYQLGCESYTLGFEVKEIDKLDDTIIDCIYNGRKFAFFIQAKHNTARNEVFLNNFFSPTQKGCAKRYWKKYNLRQFVEALMSSGVQRSLEKYKDHTQRYVIVTNNSVKTDDVETIVEKCEGFNAIFKKFLENESIVIKFGQAFKNEMQKIIDTINDEARDKTKLHQLDQSYLLDKIVVLSNVPNFEDLEGLCDKFVKSIFANNNSDLMPRFLRQNLYDFIKPVNNMRKFINQKNFREIIDISIQEVELTRMTETFIQSIKFHANFDKEIIENFRDKLKGKRIIECDGSVKLSVLKVYDALKSSEVKVFLLQLSMLSKSYENSFKLPRSKIIIYVDCAKNYRELLQYKNVILIVQKGFCIDVQPDQRIAIEKPGFEEFSNETKKMFFRKKIKMQGHSVALFQIHSLIYRNSEISMSFIDDLAEEFATKDEVIFGKKLPVKANFYIMRNFSAEEKKNLNDQDLLRDLSNVIIVADPGMGKTSTTAKLAADFKTEHPHFWVGVLFLSDLTRIFSEYQCMREWNSEDCILDILTKDQENEAFCRILLKIYLMEQQNSPMLLFFDGYDEIYPQYSDIVEVIITKLREMNVRIFVTTRSHCVAAIENLQGFSSVQMHLFEKFQRNIFIRRYIELVYPDDNVEETIARINEVLSSDVFDDKFLGTPILLRMIIDICKKQVNYAQNIKNLTIFNIYDDIFEMSFDGYYAKEKIDATLNAVAGKRSLELKKIKEIYSFIAINEVGMQKIIPHDVVEFTEIEVIARGFVTKTPEGGFRFIHRTFAEYFVGEAICGQIMKKQFNSIVNLMRYINDHYDEQIPQFAYLSILDKAQKGSLELCAENFQDYCKIFKSLYFSRRITNEVDFAIMLEYVESKLTSQELIDFLLFQFKSYQQLTKNHIDFLLNFLQLRCETSTIDHLLSILVSQNFTDKKYFHTAFQNLLVSRRIQTQCESFEKIYEDFGAQYTKGSELNLKSIYTFFSKNTNYSKEIHFAVFENRGETIEDEVKEKIMSKYAEISEFDVQDIILMNYLALYLIGCSHFLKELLGYFFEKKILMSFFKKLARTHFYIDTEAVDPFSIRDYSTIDCEQFIGMCIEIFMENQWEKEKFDGKTLLFYCWTSEDILVMTPFLDHLPMEIIADLASSPNFSGKSAIEYFHTDEDTKEFPINYLEYLYKKSPREELFNLIVSFRNPNAYRKNISLFDNLFCSMHNNVVDRETYDAMTEKIAEEITKELQELQINLLYPFACNYFYIGLNHPLIDELFGKLTKLSAQLRSFGERKNYYVHCLKQIDEDGNNLLHIAAKNNNNDFIEHLSQSLSLEELVEHLKKKNVEGKNYFHCTGDTLLWTKKIELPQKDLSEMLLEQDVNGRTPFHRLDADFFMSSSRLLTDDDLVVLLKIEDTEGNNILHHLAREISKGKNSREFKIHLTLVITATMKNEMRKACEVANRDGKTPKDLGFISF